MADLPFHHQLTKQETAQREGTKEGAESTKSLGGTCPGSHEGSILLILTNTCYTLYSTGTQLGMGMGATVLMSCKK